jgi:hypothetical protein
VVIETLVALAAVQTAPAVSRLTVEKSRAVSEIDAGRLKGEPTRLAWSPDGASLYLLMLERKRDGATPHHYVMSAADGVPKKADAAPEWVEKYWAWKSGQAAPGQADFKIELIQEQRTERATAAPMGGDLARGGATSGSGGQGTSLGAATAAVAQSQQVSVITLKLRGEVIGEFINGPLVPGLTYSWSPSSLGVIAYADKGGKLVLMDRDGATAHVADTNAALLPAWSDDGNRLAFLEKDGRRKYKLQIADVKK